jgi:hypothetical protein
MVYGFGGLDAFAAGIPTAGALTATRAGAAFRGRGGAVPSLARPYRALGGFYNRR